jgi:hypothetical protein
MSLFQSKDPVCRCEGWKKAAPAELKSKSMPIAGSQKLAVLGGADSG